MVAAPRPEDTADSPRRRGRLASAGLTVLLVGIGAWFALRRRRPQLPAFADEARPSPVPRPSPVAPGTAPSVEPTPAMPSPPEFRAASPETPPSPLAPPVPTGSPSPSPPASGAELLAVSGIGRRSAVALAVAGITTLGRLAESADAELVAAVEAAGLRRSPTLSTWANQARRLSEG